MRLFELQVLLLLLLLLLPLFVVFCPSPRLGLVFFGLQLDSLCLPQFGCWAAQKCSHLEFIIVAAPDAAVAVAVAVALLLLLLLCCSVASCTF